MSASSNGVFDAEAGPALIFSSSLTSILDKIYSAKRITRSEAIELFNTAPLLELAQAAHYQRQRKNPGNIVTYLVDRNINYTNVCNTDCSFCAFYRPTSQHPESYVLSRDTLRQKIEEALELGATRILLQGGHNDDLPYSFYVELVKWIHENFPIEINSFSPSEIQQMRKISGKSYHEILAELQQAGMAGLPGGGAEILDDEVRKRISPKKTKSEEWLAIMEAAHHLGLTTTATMVIGFGETLEQRLNHLERLRTCQERSLEGGYNGFNCFISWTAQLNENTSMGRSRFAPTYGAGGIEYLKNLALARVFLDNIPHHQASWPTLGPEFSQVGLHFGCDDIGSTMMEENVVSQAGAPSQHKWSMSPEELRGYIREAGFVPAQRNSSFDIIRTFE